MGNIFTSSCFIPTSPSMVKLIFYGGKTQLLPNNHIAGEILIQNQDQIICHADSFFIGRPIPILSIEDPLLVGQTYFILPVDLFPSSKSLTPSSLAALSSSLKKKEFPFEYVKGNDGRMMIKVLPEFIIRAISDNTSGCDGGGNICTTPELRKHYEQLVGSREQGGWSPKLETITEKKASVSPVRLLGLERR